MVVPVVGLNNNEHGHSCECHFTCGDQVKVGDLLRVLAVEHPSDKLGIVLAVFTMKDGKTACKVGFLQKAMELHRNLYHGLY